MEKINWSALEYEERDRSKDWFWALGVIVATGAIAAIIFDDYFFAALLVIGGFLLGLFAVKKPRTVFYELNSKGLQIGSRLFPYENIKSFWVQVDVSGEANIKSMLFVHSERIFMPIIAMPIQRIMANDIHSLMLAKNIPEVEMKETPSEKIMEALGF